MLFICADKDKTLKHDQPLWGMYTSDTICVGGAYYQITPGLSEEEIDSWVLQKMSHDARQNIRQAPANKKFWDCTKSMREQQGLPIKSKKKRRVKRWQAEKEGLRIKFGTEIKRACGCRWFYHVLQNAWIYTPCCKTVVEHFGYKIKGDSILVKYLGSDIDDWIIDYDSHDDSQSIDYDYWERRPNK